MHAFFPQAVSKAPTPAHASPNTDNETTKKQMEEEYERALEIRRQQLALQEMEQLKLACEESLRAAKEQQQRVDVDEQQAAVK